MRETLAISLMALAFVAAIAAMMPDIIKRSGEHEAFRMAKQCAYYGDKISRHADANNQNNPCEGI